MTELLFDTPTAKEPNWSSFIIIGATTGLSTLGSNILSGTSESKFEVPVMQRQVTIMPVAPAQLKSEAKQTKRGIRVCILESISDSSDIATHTTKQWLTPLLTEVFDQWSRLKFEDGMLTPFSVAIIDLITYYGNDAVESLALKVLDRKTSPEASGEALRWIGRIEDHNTHGMRKWLLTRALFSSSPRVRDGAILGLGALDDKSTIGAVTAAHTVEKNEWLKDDLKALMSQLSEDQ